MNCINCPVELGYSSMNVFIADILAKNPKIKRWCKVEITDAHKLEAVYLAKYKWNKEEEARIAKEKAEADAAAAAEGEG